MLHRGNRCRLHRVVYLEVPAMKVTCEHIEAIVREAVGKLEAIRNAPEGAAPSQDDALAQMTKERDEWSHKANEWRRKYAELRYPGMTNEVHAAAAPDVVSLEAPKDGTLWSAIDALDAGHDPFCLKVIRHPNKQCTCGLAAAPVVALGGEKGEAVAGEKLNELLDAYAEIAYQNGVEFCAGNEGDLEGELTAKRAVLALFADPVGKARMLTDLEITRCWEATFGYLELGIAIQHKFCEKNGIEVLS